MVAYNDRILATSTSAPRRHRAERMLANLRPHLERLEREEAERVGRIAGAAPPASSFEGAVQRWRDERQAAAGGAEPDLDPPEPDDPGGDDEDAEDLHVAISCAQCGADATVLSEDGLCRSCVRRRRHRERPPVDRRRRSVAEASGDSGSSWWANKDRDSFAQSAAQRAEELRGSKEAARVKTPLNFV